MGYRFLDDYDPRKEQKKKQQQKGTQKAPTSGTPLNSAAQNNKNNKTNTPAATQPRTSKGTALGGSSVTPVQLPQRQLTVPKLTKATVSTRKTTATRVPQQLKIPEIKAFGASMPTARKTAATSRQTVDTATIPEIRAFGAGMPTARKTETTARRAVDTAKMPEIKAFGAGDYSAGAKSLEDFFTRVGKTIAGGSKGALASNMDAMGAAYEAGQGQRTSMYEAELREAQWAVARAKRDYDLDPSQTTKTELDAALTKMKAFATVLGDGAYQQALTAAYDAAVKIGTVETTKELTALYNSLGKVNVDASTGVQQQATEAARDMALDVQVSGGKDIASAKEGLGQFGQMVVDAGASGTQMAIDILLNKVMGTPGSKLPFAFRAFGGATQQARADGADISGQLLYGGAVAAKEVATEMIFNIALPFTKAYGGGALDDVVQNGIQKAVNKLGKTDAGKRALNALLQIGASGMSEGLEEFIGDWMEWQMPRLYGGEVSSAEETLANSLYDYVVGGLSGMGGAVISPGTYRLEMPTLTDAQGRTYEQRQAAEASGQRTATRYTAEEAAAKRKDARTFRNIIAGIDTSISDFFDRWKSGRKSHLGEKLEQLYIAPMPNNMAEDISKIVGYNVNGRDFIVTSDDVKHVMDQHGNPDVEIAKGNIPLETWMLDALPDVVTNPDSIEPGNLGTGNKNAGKRGIVFSKAFPGGKIITIQFDNKGRGTLELNTLYAKESAILEGNGTNAPNTFTPEAAKSALSYAEKTRMSRYTMPNTTESAVPVINVQSGPPQSFFSETSVPQGGTGVNTQGMQDGGEYAAAPAAPLQVPRLTTYEERQAEQRAERVANLVDNIDALHEAVDNGLRSPQLTTYEERARAKAEAEKASVRDRVRQMDAMTDAAAERAVEQRVQQEQQGREMPEALKKLGVAPFGSEADYAGIDNLAQEMQWNGSARKQTQRQMNKIPATEKERSFARKLADALYAAADVTVNFGRAGTLGKVLNANYVPFLNPGIQGFDKMIRRVTETKGGKEWAKLIVRAAALGVAPALLNSLLYHDDEEWDDLRDSDKDTNYLFKLGNGTWLKIPKGRELSLLGITADRIGDAVHGKDVDLIATINTMGNQVAPANPLTSNIASALFEAQLFDPSSPGRTWYGGDIENQRLQSYAPGQRYDSSTDIFSKAVGGALGISPKKLNYVLDQYSGVVGDFLLPLLTPQAERGMFSKAFTVDVVTSNRLSGDFYDKADALTYAKNGGDEAAAVVSRFWSKQQSACSDLYKQIREVESSDLSDREKRQKTRELKALVNGIQKNAMAVEETYRAAVEKNLQKGMDADDAYRAANKDCFGAEYALQVYNKDVYEKAKSAKSNGVSYDDYYAYYFGTRGFEKSGDTSVTTQKFDWLQSSGMVLASQAEIYFADMASDKVLETQAELEMSSGITAVQFYQYKVASSGMTKKAEKMQAINSLDLTSAQKDAIYYAEGWAQSTIRDAPWRGGDGGNYSRESSSSSRYLSYLAEKNGYTLQEAAPSAPRYSGYLQYLAARDGIPLDTEDTGSGLQSKYLQEFASRWGG